MSAPTHAAAAGGHDKHIMSVQTNIIVFAALMILLVLTVGAAYMIHGPLGILTAMIIASIKAALIIAYFMHIRFSSKLQLIFSVSAFFWLALMILITLSDYLSRGWLPIEGK
jgi:cytochrome c oxidase subunit 4